MKAIGEAENSRQWSVVSQQYGICKRQLSGLSDSLSAVALSQKINNTRILLTSLG